MARVDRLSNAPPDKPHWFVPRKKGSREACQVCGGTVDNQIHIGAKRVN